MTATAEIRGRFNLPAMATVGELARLTGLSEKTIRRCIRANSAITDTADDKPTWPPLTAKRLPDGSYRITAESAAAWIDAFPDA